MLYFIVIIIFIIFFIIIYGLLSIINHGKTDIKSRIYEVKSIYSENESIQINDNIDDISFSDRAIKPLYEYISSIFLKITPKNKIKVLNKKLEKAGLLKNCTADKWIFKRNMIVIILGIFTASLIFFLSHNILNSIVFSILMMLLTNIISDFYLAYKIKKRKKILLHDLPFTLDLITVSVEAGLSFDGAMVRVVNNLNGDLCDEFAKSLKEIKMGIQRKTALKNMSERCGVKELSMLITSLIQADEMGIGLGKVLRIEASNLRSHLKQAARERAMKAPVKMLFPLIFFIFPSIFIIILGPAVIRMIDIFSK